MTPGLDSPPTGGPAVSVTGVTKRFESRRGVSVTALDDIDLDVERGEFVTIVGPSGCGKSTLLKAIAGLDRPTRGEIRIDGDLLDGPDDKVGVVYQAPLLLPWRTVMANVMLPAEIRGTATSETKDRARRLLEVVGLTAFADSYPHQLSGGMQQRVGIARALLGDPEILLMDEPFGALDAMTREQLTLELLSIWQEFRKTIVFVTHSISESVLLARRVVVMSPRPGRIAGIVHVDLPYPRDLSATATERFGRLTEQVRELLDEAQASNGAVR